MVDLQLDVCDELTGAVLFRVGGLWDRKGREYVDDAATSRVVTLHQGQLPAAEWLDEWLDDHLRRRAGHVGRMNKREYSALFAGGRRSGKTYFGVLSCIAYAIAVPRSIVWIVCPTDKDYEEIEDYIQEFLPSAWYQSLGAPHYRYTLINGSKIVLRSGYTPIRLKKGRCDFALFNEGQQQKEQSFFNVRAAIADRGGAVLVAANPPDVGDQGTWVGDFASDAQQGLRQAKFLPFDPLDNPHIDQVALMALAEEMDPRTFDIQIRGMFLGASNAVFYNWNRLVNEKVAPKIRHITREFTRTREKKGFDQIVGIDVQQFPHICAVIYRIYRHKKYPKSTKRVRWWVIDEIALEGGDEIDLAEGLVERGYDPDRTLIVLDASGWWQTAATAGRPGNKSKASAKLLTGRGSRDILQECGFPHIVRPDKRQKRNPDLVERCRATTALIRTKAGESFLFVDPVAAPMTAKAIRHWPAKNGKPSRSSTYSHIGDGLTYPVHRLCPRRHRSVASAVDIVSKRPSAGRIERGGY